MDPALIDEQQIRSQIEELWTQFPQTKDIYREVCALLFFRYGVTPTANKLYQLVHKGSMSAPSEALALFWKDLREKSRVRIEHPDLPEDLKHTAGELVASLWGKAQISAQESLKAYREEAHASILKAQSKQATAEEHQRELSVELLTIQQKHAVTLEQNRSLNQKVIAAAAAQTKMENQLQHEQEAKEQLQQALGTTRLAMEGTRHNLESATEELESTKQELLTTRQQLTTDIDQLKAALECAKLQHQNEKAELTAKLDQAQTASEQLQKDLEYIQVISANAAEQHRIEAAKTQEENGNLRQQVGVLEGKLQNYIAQYEALSTEVKDLRSQHSEVSLIGKAARVEAEIWKGQAQNLEKKLAELSRLTQKHSTDN